MDHDPPKSSTSNDPTSILRGVDYDPESHPECSPSNGPTSILLGTDYDPKSHLECGTSDDSRIEIEERTGPDGIEIEERTGPDARFLPGYHFAPHDHELIIHYLAKKIAQLPLPYDIFNDVNLYEYNPKDLVEKYKEWGNDRWYFFTSRDRKYPNGIRPNRKIVDGSGYWKATGVEKPIQDEEGIKIGVRKALVFYLGKPGKGEKTEWIMYEYIKQDPSDPPRKPDGSMKLDAWVLCTIQKKRWADELECAMQPKRRGDRRQVTTARSNRRPTESQVQQILQQDVGELAPVNYHAFPNIGSYGSTANYRVPNDGRQLVPRNELVPPNYQVIQDIGSYDSNTNYQVIPQEFTDQVIHNIGSSGGDANYPVIPQNGSIGSCSRNAIEKSGEHNRIISQGDAKLSLLNNQFIHNAGSHCSNAHHQVIPVPLNDQFMEQSILNSFVESIYLGYHRPEVPNQQHMIPEVPNQRHMIPGQPYSLPMAEPEYGHQQQGNGSPMVKPDQGYQHQGHGLPMEMPQHGYQHQGNGLPLIGMLEHGHQHQGHGSLMVKPDQGYQHQGHGLPMGMPEHGYQYQGDGLPLIGMPEHGYQHQGHGSLMVNPNQGYEHQGYGLPIGMPEHGYQHQGDGLPLIGMPEHGHQYQSPMVNPTRGYQHQSPMVNSTRGYQHQGHGLPMEMPEHGYQHQGDSFPLIGMSEHRHQHQGHGSPMVNPDQGCEHQGYGLPIEMSEHGYKYQGDDLSLIGMPEHGHQHQGHGLPMVNPDQGYRHQGHGLPMEMPEHGYQHQGDGLPLVGMPEHGHQHQDGEANSFLEQKAHVGIDNVDYTEEELFFLYGNTLHQPPHRNHWNDNFGSNPDSGSSKDD